jgi:DNA mismatch repair protein MutH
MITRAIAIKNLEKYIGQDLAELAESYEIIIFKGDTQNKGWKGLTLERLAGLNNDNKQAPNGLGFELKSVAFEKKGDVYQPRETMAITMLNPRQLIDTSFFESHCWEKLKSLVFCACLWNGKNNSKSE